MELPLFLFSVLGSRFSVLGLRFLVLGSWFVVLGLWVRRGLMKVALLLCNKGVLRNADVSG